jgi:hypothetical protein
LSPQSAGADHDANVETTNEGMAAALGREHFRGLGSTVGGIKKIFAFLIRTDIFLKRQKTCNSPRTLFAKINHLAG